MTKNKSGRLIVIDGIDGVGKATQIELLAGRLRHQKFKVETIDFPRYYDNLFGKLIGECLAGEHGDFLALDPRIASALYAADRYESKKQIESWLQRGRLVLADRYVSANQIHQGGKIDDPRARAQFLRWLDEMEYGAFGLPRPDLIIYLDLPAEMSQKLLLEKRRSAFLSYKKRYAGGGVDQAEDNPTHLENARQNALRLVAENNKWVRINCAPENKLLTKAEIHLAIAEAIERETGLDLGNNYH